MEKFFYGRKFRLLKCGKRKMWGGRSIFRCLRLPIENNVPSSTNAIDSYLVIPVKFNSIFNSRDFIIDIGILNIIYKFATRKIHHSVNWICLSLSVPLRIFPPFNPSHFSPSPSLPSSPYLPLIYRESYPSFHKTFYTHFGQLVSGRRSYCSIN